MNDETLIRFARWTRPVIRRRTPVLYRLYRHLIALVCPKGRPGRSRRLVAPFEGGRIHIDTASAIEYHLLFRGCHEPLVTDLIRDHVRPGDTCLDAGANIGAHTLIMATATGPQGRVVAVEPHPAIRERLLANLALNECHQVQVIDAALSDADGETVFYGFDADQPNQGLSSLEPGPGARREMRVRTISGEVLCREGNLESCDFIKIDVEGHDAVAVRELWPVIEAHKPTVVFEYRDHHWARFGESGPAVVQRFRDLGYELRVIRKYRVRPLEGDLPSSCEVVCLRPG